ncbi:type I toxin-antitoxin system Hok family toxin [Escherichia coli]|nr:type I toxin-antitoxin system Hok family toxin [Escherichia coli]
MKQQKAMLIALIVICLTVIVTALVTRKDLCEYEIRTGQMEVAVFVDYESRSKSDLAGE